MDDLEGDELIVELSDPGHEEQARVSAIDDLRVLVLEEVAHARSTGLQRGSVPSAV